MYKIKEKLSSYGEDTSSQNLQIDQIPTPPLVIEKIPELEVEVKQDPSVITKNAYTESQKVEGGVEQGQAK